ncbi:hypothetical protein AGMMS50293_08710 [Spirochaetia bacterium]|nr:hypothetical protein AGMMS50293_08710 [Spirochaetia bacterium]
MYFLKKIVCFPLVLLFTAAALFGVPEDPPATDLLVVSCAENLSGLGANSNGVYPVRIRWQKPAVAVGSVEPWGYHIYRSPSADAGFSRISAEPIPVARESGGFFTYFDENPDAMPGKPYYYRVLSLNAQGEGSNYSEIHMGYGALSHEQYLREYSKTVKSSHQKMIYMNKTSAMSKLGSETKNGAISGSLAYRAQIVGLGGRVTMRYENYADFYIENNNAQGPYFVLTGDMNTAAGMNQSGSMDGTITVSGMYPGRVFYDNVQIKSGKAGGGTYGIEPAGFPRRELGWTLGEI